MAGVPEPDPRVPKDLAWWERFRVALAAFPPPAGDASFLALAERFGVTATESPDVDPDPGLAEVLAAGQQTGQAKIEELAGQAKIEELAGQAKIEELAGQGGADAVNGWTSALHAFENNLDRLGLGTIDAPEWKIPDRQRAYVGRRPWPRVGCGAATATRLTTPTSGPTPTASRWLNGGHRYRSSGSSTLPPVGAFWSLTMYDVPDFHLVANPIDRYSIGDRTPGPTRAPTAR